MDLQEKIRVIENFPKEGISFKDITTLIADGEALRETINRIVKHLEDKKIDLIVGPEARGFIFGVPVAYALGIGFIPVRKQENYQEKLYQLIMDWNMEKTSFNFIKMQSNQVKELLL